MIPDPLFSPEGCRIRDPLYFTPRPETRLVEHATLDLLDPHRLSFYLHAKEQENPTLARCSRSQQLHMLNLSYEGTPTVAAMMHFCAFPQGFFPRFQLLTAVVDAPEWEESSVRERKRLNGSISDLYDQACALCRTFAPEYPSEVLEELIMNSLIHRDYSAASDQIPGYLVFFSDHIEVWNPIGQDHFELKTARTGSAPELPNPTIASIAQSLLGTHLAGSGLPRIRHILEEAGLPQLDHRVEDRELCMTVRKDAAASADVEKQLLDFCRTPRSRKEIAEFLQVGTVFYAMQRYVRPLLAEGRLVMTMPDKPQSSHQRFVRTPQHTG